MDVKFLEMTATLTMTERGYYQTTEEISAEMELVKAAQEDPRCFEPLYTAYYRRIVAYVYHRTESKDEAFEITAQVFYKALSNLGKYVNKGVPFSAWLFRIAGNELNSRHRRSKGERMVSLDDEGFTELKTGVEAGTSDHLDEHLFNALQQLEAAEMELIDMRFFEKRSFKEIADILNMGESACKMRLYRILEKLKTKLTHL
jgi:RNA polymerase sigma-70 factor (ECF subfamily)